MKYSLAKDHNKDAGATNWFGVVEVWWYKFEMFQNHSNSNFRRQKMSMRYDAWKTFLGVFIAVYFYF